MENIAHIKITGQDVEMGAFVMFLAEIKNN